MSKHIMIQRITKILPGNVRHEATSAHSRPIVRSLKPLQLHQRTTANRMLLPRTGANKIVPTTLARSAHPTDPPGRISHHKCEVRDIPCDNGTRSYETEFSKRMTAHHGGIRSDRCPLPNWRGTKFI